MHVERHICGLEKKLRFCSFEQTMTKVRLSSTELRCAKTGGTIFTTKSNSSSSWEGTFLFVIYSRRHSQRTDRKCIVILLYLLPRSFNIFLFFSTFLQRNGWCRNRSNIFVSYFIPFFFSRQFYEPSCVSYRRDLSKVNTLESNCSGGSLNYGKTTKNKPVLVIATCKHKMNAFYFSS